MKLTEDYESMYSEIHEGTRTYPGKTIKMYVDRIVELVAEHKPKRMLDYGSGKGYQYLADRYHDRWGGLLPHCYDVGVRQLRDRPTGKFDAIISTDMLEHIAEADLTPVLSDIFQFADKQAFVFLGIAVIPSKRALPDGRNAHLTVKPPDWWRDRVSVFKRPGLVIDMGFGRES